MKTKRHYRNAGVTGIICIALMVALIGISVSFAASGILNLDYLVSECQSLHAFGFTEALPDDNESILPAPKDIGTCECVLQDENGDSYREKLNIALGNVYPQYEAYVDFVIQNHGAYPIHLKSVDVCNPSPEAMSVNITNLVCTMLAPGETTSGTITVSILQTAAQAREYSFSVSIIAGEPSPPPEAEWTFMVYMDADNDLEQFGIDDINEMELAGSTDDVNIVALVDRIAGDPEWDDVSNGDWTDARLFHITQDLTYDPMAPVPDRTIRSTQMANLGEVNMGDPATLVDFITWSITNYPAEHYALVLWDHGDGWKVTPNFSVFPPQIPLCLDMTSGDSLEIPELRSSLADAGTIFDIVGFDACLMATAEVDYQIRDYANIRVGSQESSPPLGWPYYSILGSLTAAPSMSPEDLATQIVNDYVASYIGFLDPYPFEYIATMSAAYLNDCHSTTLAEAVNEFASALIDNANWMSIALAAWGTAPPDIPERFMGDPDYIDLYDFAARVKLTITDPIVQSKAQAVMDAIANAVLAENHGMWHPNAHGISIYFPIEEDSLLLYSGYLEFTADTLWDDFLAAYYENTGLFSLHLQRSEGHD